MQKVVTIGNTDAYYSTPDDAQKHPGIILIEEIWGMNEHIKSVVDRFAAAGFCVVSPELLPEGMLAQLTPELQKDLFDPEKRNALQPKLREITAPVYQSEFADGAIAKLKACVDFLESDEHCNGKVAVIGFCFGGTYTFHMAAHDMRIRAAVPFYGRAPAEDEVRHIDAPVLAFYGDQDAPLMESLPKLKEDMAKHSKDFEAIIYPGAGHAFFNDTNELQYRPQYAKEAWEKTLAFLQKHLV